MVIMMTQFSNTNNGHFESERRFSLSLRSHDLNTRTHKMKTDTL